MVSSFCEGKFLDYLEIAEKARFGSSLFVFEELDALKLVLTFICLVCAISVKFVLGQCCG